MERMGAPGDLAVAGGDLPVMKHRTVHASVSLVTLGLALAFATGPAAAQNGGRPRTVSNVATVEWANSGARQSLSSNRVDIAVDTGSNTVATAEAFRFGGGSGETSAALAGAKCSVGGDYRPVPLAAAWSGMDRASAPLSEMEAVRPGEPLMLMVTAPSVNRDPGRAEELATTLRASAGDREQLLLVETAPDSGRFAGLVQTVPAPPGAVANNCELSVAYGERLSLDLEGEAFGQGLRFDLAVMPPEAATALLVAKSASEALAEPGDVVGYRVTVRNPGATPSGAVTVTDRLPAAMRLRAGSVRFDGMPVAHRAENGRLALSLSPIPAGGAGVLTYFLEVRPDARAGDAVNSVRAVDAASALAADADAVVRIRRERIAERMTVIGRVTDGGCAIDPRTAPGIPGVRVMLEDGSYAVTDADGRYHFEGVVPGLHVVQVDDSTLPADRGAVDCARNTRSAGRAFSRFVEGGGGSLKRVDFRAVTMPARRSRSEAPPPRPQLRDAAAAAGGGRDWLAGQKPGIEWLFPEVDHNPRAPVVRVAIKHAPGQQVQLLTGGRAIDKVAFDGTTRSADGLVAVSVWRGIGLPGQDTLLTAEVRDARGTLVERLERKVHYGDSPIRAELIKDRSRLVADGVTRPVIAVRFTDRDGKPVHHGLVGEFAVPAPYYPAVEADAQQARQLAGLERARPVWRVSGEDGVAYIELEPTTASGTLTLTFPFRVGEVAREQRLDLWLEPGDRPWTVVGFAAGTLGFDVLRRSLEQLDRRDPEVLKEGRVALYARGRISGRWLLTFAYDSDKERDEARFGGVIDPDAYYTVYADRSDRRFDASSIRKLYVKLERPHFYALFGDYETGVTEPRLARYARAFNGLKAEYRTEQASATAFAADTPFRHRRDEIQGTGLSGPYAFTARSLVPNSETIAIETRDRFRSDLVLDTRRLTRHVDYDIDYADGLVRFREPVLSRSTGLDPQFIVADYEVDGVARRATNAGGRASWRSRDGKLQLSGTALRDNDGARETTLGGADLRYRPNAATELRAEVAASRGEGAVAGAAEPGRGTTAAWMVEAEHHGARYDLLAYAREQQSGFGVGQTNLAENGTRKFGFDGRVRVTDALSITASGWRENYLESKARRMAARALVEFRTNGADLRAGLTMADDRLADGREALSTLVQLGATKRLFNNRLEFDAQTEFPLGGEDDSLDFPARHRVAARYAVSSDVTLVGSYELAEGDAVEAQTARIGFDLKPWAGARFALTANQQDIAEYGPRSFAAYGLSQSLALGPRWSVDFSLDGNRTIGGFDPARVLNPLHPVADGGYIGDGNLLTEDFTAVTAGATFRRNRWTATGRAEYRLGDRGDRRGLTFAVLRQIGEGSALGAALHLHEAELDDGSATRTAGLELSWAHRPHDSRLSWLNKLEARDDLITGAVAGEPGPIGGAPLLVEGDARARRIVNGLSLNWSPTERGRDGWTDQAEVSLFWGSRYASDRIGPDDVKGWSNMVGADLRFDLARSIDIGASASVRHGRWARALSYSVGPSIGIAPIDNGWLSIGWNLLGFHDRDFSDDRYTRSGPYVTARLKFDQLSLQSLTRAVR